VQYATTTCNRPQFAAKVRSYSGIGCKSVPDFFTKVIESHVSATGLTSIVLVGLVILVFYLQQRSKIADERAQSLKQMHEELSRQAHDRAQLAKDKEEWYRQQNDELKKVVEQEQQRRAAGLDAPTQAPPRVRETVSREVVAEATEHLSEAPVKGRRRVIVVDDHEVYTRLTSEILEMHGYEAVAAFDTEQALSIMAAAPSPFDALIADIVMPGRNGIELSLEAQEKYHPKAIFIVSGYPALYQSARHRLNAMYIPKTDMFPRLLEELKKALTNQQQSGSSDSVASGLA
jgi:CheY-like chemotaxis protein